jgi:hypothetical protein
MLYSKIIALSSEIHTKHIIIYVCGTHNFLLLKLMVHAVTTKLGFKKLNFARVELNQVVYRHKWRVNLAKKPQQYTDAYGITKMSITYNAQNNS